VNPPTQTGLTSTSPDRQPAPGASFVRGKSGYAPFWPGGLDAIVTKSDEGDTKGSASEAKGLRTVPPGLKRGLRLSTDQDRDSTLSEQYDPGLDGHEIAAESPVAIPFHLEHASDLRTCNSPRCYPTALSSRNSIRQTYH
jgi:antiviral helicase SKI2